MPITYLAAVLLVLTVSPEATAEPSWVPLSIDSSGTISVPVAIGGQGPFSFALDTGSNRSVISRSLAERLNLPYVAKTSVLTAAGEELRPVVRLDLTTIGTERSENLLASVAPSTAAIGPDVEGIIGQDFLFDRNYTLDYRGRRLWWSGGELTAAPSARLPLVVREGRYLVCVDGLESQRPMLLVPDSGANGLVMFARGGRTPMPLETLRTSSVIHGLSGRLEVKMMMMRELRVGRITLRHQPVAVVPRDDLHASEADGLLPLHLFNSVTFNARERYMVVDSR